MSLAVAAADSAWSSVTSFGSGDRSMSIVEVGDLTIGAVVVLREERDAAASSFANGTVHVA